MSVARIDHLTPDQTARMDQWADRWIEIGLRTGPADRERWEAAARACYRFAGIDWPGVVIWVPSPLALALSGPAAALAIGLIEALHRRGEPVTAVSGTVRGAVRGAVGGAVATAVDGAVDGAVGGAVGDAVYGAVRGAVAGAVSDAVGGTVRGAVEGAVSGAVGDAVRGAVDGAVGTAVDGAVDDAVSGTVDGAVGTAVDGAVDDAVSGTVDGAVGTAVRGAVGDADGAVRGAVGDAIGRSWPRYIGGQFWCGGWWRWGAAYTSFFREVCGLALPGDLWQRAAAYEATVESACWWWPHRRFVIASERPLEIHRELVSSDEPRGWGSHRLHRDDGPAVVWPDGWGVWSVHGVRVPRQVVEAPATLTPSAILGEPNAEVRRVMIERFGAERLLREAEATLLDEIHEPPFAGLIDAALYRLEVRDDEPIVMVRCRNTTPESDGSHKPYWLRVPPDCETAHQALAWTWGMDEREYEPTVET